MMNNNCIECGTPYDLNHELGKFKVCTVCYNNYIKIENEIKEKQEKEHLEKVRKIVDDMISDPFSD